MNKKKGILTLLLTVVLIALLGFTSIVGFGKKGSGSAKNIILGLDLQGGVSITYEVKNDNPTDEQMRDTIYKLQQRVTSYSTEAVAYQEGDDRINIEIPGISDANAVLQELGKPGSLLFQTEDGETVLEGTDIQTAEAFIGQDKMGNRDYQVNLTLTSEGATKFAAATAANLGKTISIIFDDEVVSAPTVNNTISNGIASITGMQSNEESEKLASIIRIGGLQLELEELRSNVVGAQLGEEAISTSLLAGAIGILLVILFMCIVYLLPGIASSIALIIYVGLMLVSLNAFDLTLTLPGIAGIILSIGMAVDANVIIFARVREELAAGKAVKAALQTGFKKALSAIVDGNITTLIAALVLGLKGSGSIKGFAMTLALGIVLSMISALLITRLIIFAFYSIGLKSEKLYGVQKPRKTVDFLSKKNICFIISGVLIIAGFVAMGLNKGSSATSNEILNYSLEFKGGTSTTVTFNDDLSLSEIDSQVKPIIQGVTGDSDIQAQKVTGSKQVIFKTRELSLDEREKLNAAMVENFEVDDSLIAAESISSSISKEVKQDAVVSVIIATICMLIYIWFRFKDIRFATSAVVALLHDVLIVLAFYAVARISIGNTFIACMLTIVGYSINATIVIFDRIRENQALGKYKNDIKELVNVSITQTLTRSIYTTLTTFVMVAALFVLGVPSIRDFALPLMVGIICGGYSSICITGALWYVMKTKIKAKTSK